MPNGTSIHSSHTRNLLLSTLPWQARKARILHGLVHNSLIYVGQLYNSGCHITFNLDKLEVKKDGECVILGLRDPQSRLWRVNLKEDAKPACKAECNHVHENSNLKKLINYLHGGCFSPVKSTWIKVINNGHFTSWPGLNEQAVENIYPSQQQQ
jgi:hypothetical protein